MSDKGPFVEQKLKGLLNRLDHRVCGTSASKRVLSRTQKNILCDDSFQKQYFLHIGFKVESVS